MRKRPHVLGVVLAGGEGRRLWPLTRDRAKPAVPFGATYRLVDFALSNLVNAGYLRIAVLTQYKSHSLDRHIAQTWRMSPLFGNFVMSVPAQMRIAKRWFEGSADAIYQNLNLLGDENPEYICVFGADHIYRMDASQLVEAHVKSGAGVTVAGIRVPRAECNRFGVIEPDDSGRIKRFREKPEDAEGLPDAPDQVFASMGNYVFSRRTLENAVVEDAKNAESHHDMGGDIITMLVERGEAAVYDFATNKVPGSTERDRGYWRDVGTLDSYYDAHRDLISVHPVFNLYNEDWPIHTWYGSLPPAKFVFDQEGRRGMAIDSIVSAGTIVAGGVVRRSILSPGVRVEPGSEVTDSVLMQGVRIGAGAIVRRAILDKNVSVPAGARIGVDLEEDKARGYTFSDNGIVVLGKGDEVPAPK
ncbi:MAG: glucose-1-phosphate adenylyltransferase [Polyangiaceae bacterium]|nr:glucose-1-phosphate adenylyltransferase [Polyangiaceae bacterium]MCE7893585.1 glucose-1-phosphate adenylyltransferase [Sorangiineae bacterium PRO1]MCL4751732.1 glucose-1-phosphate adenylyltransferase [Myxococcales bacterium]